jgi:hypothetical protein
VKEGKRKPGSAGAEHGDRTPADQVLINLRKGSLLLTFFNFFLLLGGGLGEGGIEKNDDKTERKRSATGVSQRPISQA